MVAEQEQTLKSIAKEHEACVLLQKVPGIGYLTATALLTVAGRPADFKNGREFAAYLGLVPRQHSTGGKSRMFGITKRGDRTVRTLLIHGARAVLRSMKMGYTPLGDGGMTAWLQGLLDRRGYNRACVALANKMARIAWTMLAKGTEYRMV
jgi:transposase